MKYRYISDCHLHTKCSPDGQDTAGLLCEGASRMGMYAVAITDHCECNTYREEGYQQSVRDSYLQARNAASAYNSLHVYAGVELGQPTQNLNAARDVLSSMDFDFVLASVHNLPGEQDFYFMDFSLMPQRELEQLLNHYMEELMTTVRWGDFDSLAHLTYPWRYIEGRDKRRVPVEKFSEQTDCILRELIRKDEALELNTSGLRQELGDTMPQLPLLKRYRELGGRLVTIGSDAHRWMDIGSGIETGLSLLSQAGFRYFTVFSRRKPVFLPIE